MGTLKSIKGKIFALGNSQKHFGQTFEHIILTQAYLQQLMEMASLS